MVAMRPTIVPDDALASPTREKATLVSSRGAWIIGLSGGVVVLSLVATLSAILTGFGNHHRAFLSLRGEAITMQGGGLYANDSV